MKKIILFTFLTVGLISAQGAGSSALSDPECYVEVEIMEEDRIFSAEENYKNTSLRIKILEYDRNVNCMVRPGEVYDVSSYDKFGFLKLGDKIIVGVASFSSMGDSGRAFNGLHWSDIAYVDGKKIQGVYFSSGTTPMDMEGAKKEAEKEQDITPENSKTSLSHYILPFVLPFLLLVFLAFMLFRNLSKK
jgi:hypothetical protein